jgi:transcriptional regulator GlxA family with amidase domain
MDAKDLTPISENPETNHLAAIGAKIDYCMQHYQPYIRHDFSLHHLSVITNIPESNLEIYFRQTTQPFNKYLDEFRIKYAKNLMSTGKVCGMETKTIGSLSGFSSARKFIEAFQNIEGISPETYQSQINKSKS